MYFIQRVRVQFAAAKYSYLGKKEEGEVKNKAHCLAGKWEKTKIIRFKF
jgi:hypothetical protein